MKTAQEIHKENMKRVEAAVDKFAEKWYEEGGASRTFTRKDMDEKFIDTLKAKELLVDAGFTVKVVCEYTTGHLWWKKHHPEKWEIKIHEEPVFRL